MEFPKIEGCWTGYFTYDWPYTRLLRRQRKDFSINFINDGGYLSGICVDEYTERLFNEPATIAGKVYGNGLWFIKRYPALLTCDEKGNGLVEADKLSNDIQYNGHFKRRFLGDGYFLQGEWNIPVSYPDEAGQPVQYTITGKWKMKKVD